MRATVIVPSLLRRDAVGNHTVALCRALRDLGCTVALVTGQGGDVPRDLARCLRVGAEVDADGRFADAALRRHHERSVLVVLVYAARSPLWAAARRPVAGLRVLDWHGVTPPDLWDAPGRAELEATRREVPEVARWVERCVAHSESAKRELVALAGIAAERVDVAPLSIEVARFARAAGANGLAPRGDGAPVRLLYVGRMAPSKRIDLLVDALALVRTAGVDARLTLVGDGETEPYVGHLRRALARATGTPADGCVDYRGVVPDAELDSVYAAGDVYVSASLHEGFGVPLVEAAAAGLPVVAARAGAVPETLGDSGLLVDPGDAAALGRGVLRVLREPRLRERLVAAGRARAAEFSADGLRGHVASLLAVACDGRVPGAPAATLRFVETSATARPLARISCALRLESAGSAEIAEGTAIRCDWTDATGAVLARGAAHAEIPADVPAGASVEVTLPVTVPAAAGSYVLEACALGAAARLPVEVAGEPAPPDDGERTAELAAAARVVNDYVDRSHRTGLWRLAIRFRAAVTRHLARTHVDVIARRNADVQSALVDEVRALREELAAERAAREAQRRAFEQRVSDLEDEARGRSGR